MNKYHHKSGRQLQNKPLEGLVKKKTNLHRKQLVVLFTQHFVIHSFFFFYHQVGKLVDPRGRVSLCCHYSCFHGSSSTSVHSAAEPLVAKVTWKQLAGTSIRHTYMYTHALTVCFWQICGSKLKIPHMTRYLLSPTELNKLML